jgi:hypothetical protein
MAVEASNQRHERCHADDQLASTRDQGISPKLAEVVETLVEALNKRKRLLGTVAFSTLQFLREYTVFMTIQVPEASLCISIISTTLVMLVTDPASGKRSANKSQIHPTISPPYRMNN